MWAIMVKQYTDVDKCGDKWIALWISFKHLSTKPHKIDISIRSKIGEHMFIGEYIHTIDSKGRLAIPVKFRAKLADGAVVTRGLDDCLFLYPKQEWKKMAEKLAALPVSQKDARAFARLMLAGAMDAEPDKQGRIILPAYLKKYAGINSNLVVVAGLYSKIEIWDNAKWEKFKGGAEKESSNIAEHLGELGV